MEQDYVKMKIALRAWLEGRRYYKALLAMNFAEKLHDGKRKDGSPEFSHQVIQALYLVTLIDNVIYPEETLCVIFLHDVMEDKDITYEQIFDLFDKMVADATKKMSKVIGGVRIPDDIYYSGMEDCPITTITKPVDRIHNLMSMLHGFKPKKRAQYIEETLEKVVKLGKIGRRKFPRQTPVYENIKFVMTNQVQLYNEINRLTLTEE